MAKKQTGSTAKKGANTKSGNTKKKPAAAKKQATKGTKTRQSASAEQKQHQADISHDQIAERAESIWQQRGCPPNQDEQNWLEAETQLKQESAVR